MPRCECDSIGEGGRPPDAPAPSSHAPRRNSVCTWFTPGLHLVQAVHLAYTGAKTQKERRNLTEGGLLRRSKASICTWFTLGLHQVCTWFARGEGQACKKLKPWRPAGLAARRPRLAIDLRLVYIWRKTPQPKREGRILV
jgi:hypothetical protein